MMSSYHCSDSTFYRKYPQLVTAMCEIDTRNQGFTSTAFRTSGGISASWEMILKKMGVAVRARKSAAAGTPHIAHSALRQRRTAWQWCGWWSRLHSGDLCQVSAFLLLLPLFSPYGSLPFLHLLLPPPPHINVTSLTGRASGIEPTTILPFFAEFYCLRLSHLKALVRWSGSSFTRFSWRGRGLSGEGSHSEEE